MLKNYNTSMALFSGLHSSSVSRLKQTWDHVDSKKIKILQELEIVFSPARNYKNYRSNLESCDPNVDCTVVPVVSIFVKDMTFMNDGNPKYSEPGMVNYAKARSMFTSATDFLKFSKKEHAFNRRGTGLVPGFDPKNNRYEDWKLIYLLDTS